MTPFGSILKNNLLASGVRPSEFARSAGIKASAITNLLKTTGTKQGRNIKLAQAEMERRGWVKESIIEKAFKPDLTQSVLNSDMSAEDKVSVLRSLLAQ